MKRTALLLAFGISTAAAATTVYLNDGTAVETEDDVYVSSEPLYRVTGDVSTGLHVTPVNPLKEAEAPVEPSLCDGPRPSGTVTFELVEQQQQWDNECAPEPEYVADCDAPRPAFDGTFESIDKGWIWDATCG